MKGSVSSSLPGESDIPQTALMRFSHVDWFHRFSLSLFLRQLRSREADGRALVRSSALSSALSLALALKRWNGVNSPLLVLPPIAAGKMWKLVFFSSVFFKSPLLFQNLTTPTLQYLSNSTSRSILEVTIKLFLEFNPFDFQT